MSDRVFVVDKPLGCTSRDIVNRVDRWRGHKGAGHAGTLDPQASGVIAVATGEATKLLRWLQEAPKAYRATIALGAATDSDDAAGRVIATAPLPPALSPERVERCVAAWIGTLMQVPPAVSALQFEGVRDHARARAGAPLVRAPRPVRLDACRVIAADSSSIEVEIACGAGFYVRAFARDLGLALGTLGHVAALRRIRASGFSHDDAIALHALLSLAPDRAPSFDLLDVARRVLPFAAIDADTARDLRHGKVPAWRFGAGEWFAVCDGAAIAVVESDGQVARVVRGFAPRPMRRLTGSVADGGAA